MNQDIETRLRNDINAELPVDYDVANLKALLLVLAAYVSESLRIHSYSYPPIFQLTNRLTFAPTMIGDMPIPAGILHRLKRLWSTRTYARIHKSGDLTTAFHLKR